MQFSRNFPPPAVIEMTKHIYLYTCAISRYRLNMSVDDADGSGSCHSLTWCIVDKIVMIVAGNRHVVLITVRPSSEQLLRGFSDKTSAFLAADDALWFFGWPPAYM